MNPTVEENVKNRFSIGRITGLLSILVLLSASLAVRAEFAEELNQTYIFKVLTMLMIITIAGMAINSPSGRYKKLIITGLAVSLVGDILLMAPQDLFVPGLVVFLIAQIIYTLAFIQCGGFYRSFWGVLPFAVFAIIVFYFMASDLGEMTIPVFLYLIVIMVMIWQALGQYVQTKETRALAALVGAAFFVISDTVLAVNRFSVPVEMAPLIVLGTYFLAQWLIALSAGFDHP